MVAAAILKNRSIAISRPRLGRFQRNLAWWRSSTLLTAPTVKNLKFRKSKMAAADILKNPKTPYLGRSYSDFDEIWHTDAVRPSWPFRSLKFEILKIQDGGGRHLEKSINHDIWAAVRFQRNLVRLRSSTLLTVPTVKNLKILKSTILKNWKIAIWQAFELITVNCQSNSLTTRLLSHKLPHQCVTSSF